MKSPEWTSKPGELLSNFNKIVARLDEEERELGSQGMQVIIQNDPVILSLCVVVDSPTCCTL